jgi:hypothetical protein
VGHFLTVRSPKNNILASSYLPLRLSSDFSPQEFPIEILCVYIFFYVLWTYIFNGDLLDVTFIRTKVFQYKKQTSFQTSLSRTLASPLTGTDNIVGSLSSGNYSICDFIIGIVYISFAATGRIVKSCIHKILWSLRELRHQASELTLRLNVRSKRRS